MTLLIARNADAQRVFPAITRFLYECQEKETHTVDQKLAIRLLASSAQITRWDKYFKRKRRGHDCLNRALFMHRNAFELEMAGNFPRADYFWQELDEELTRLFENAATWQSLAESLASDQRDLEVLSDPANVRERFIEELLVDTHAAFFNGYARQAEQITLESRAWEHLAHLISALEWSASTPEDTLRLIKTATEAEITLLQEAKRWKEVAERCQLLLNYDPDLIDYEELLWTANLSQRVEGFTAYGRRVHSLGAAIDDLLKLQAKNPLSLPIYQKLGELHYELAVLLADGGNISSALVAAQRALTFSQSEHAAELLAQLTQSMNELQKTAKELERPSDIYFRFTAFQRDEIRIGFRPLERYRNSDEPKQTAEAIHVAMATTLWRRIGLSKPADRWEERAGKLLVAIDCLQEKPSATRNELRERWRKIARQDQDLAEADHDLVCSFLEARLLKRTPTTVEKQGFSSAYLLEADSNSQIQQTNPPFYFWLFSRKDLRVKFQAVGALILLFGVSAIFMNNWWARSVRSASYESIIQGISNRNHLQVIDAAEKFLSHPLIATTDARDQEVIKQYNKALILWVARQPGEINPEVAARIERYQQLVGNREGGSL